MKYEVDIPKLAGWLLPPFLRKPRLLAFIKALTTPLYNRHRNFIAEQQVMLSEVRLTGQTGVLEYFLNEKFDPAEKRIRIIHADSTAIIISDARNLVLSDVEAKALVVKDDADIDTTVDFFIKIPNDLAKKYQTIINNEEGNNHPWVLSDSAATSLSDANPLSLYALLDGYQPLIISDETPFILYDLDDISTTRQIRGMVDKYKTSGKTYNLNT
ncbi:hypothetical protein [Microscilla marina]|nr:hypothetical protein [Microscilla marina]